jgi:ferric-dicitrate binding protein FerR (iron transport regulator)
MRLDDCYRLLDLEPWASDEDVKAAYRDLTKVWHPDRFANDPSIRQRAEEKLKAINEAYETIRQAGPSPRRPPRPETDAGKAAPDPAAAAWRRMYRNRAWAFVCTMVAVAILVRRPSPAGLVIALFLFGAAFFFVSRMGRAHG